MQCTDGGSSMPTLFNSPMQRFVSEVSVSHLGILGKSPPGAALRGNHPKGIISSLSCPRADSLCKGLSPESVLLHCSG
jgi:hypothetical protein